MIHDTTSNLPLGNKQIYVRARTHTPLFIIEKFLKVCLKIGKELFMVNLLNGKYCKQLKLMFL